MSKKVTEQGEIIKTYPWGSTKVLKKFPKQDIVNFYNKDVVKKIGEGEDDFIIEQKVTEYDRCDRQDYINSFKGDVGVKNQIAKAIREGESPSYVMTEKFKSQQKGLVDMIKIEDALADPDGFAKQIKESYDKLPKELKEKKSAREISEMSVKDISAYIDSAVEKYFKAREKKPVKVEGEVKNG